MPAAARAKARASVKRGFWGGVLAKRDRHPSCDGRQARWALSARESQGANLKQSRSPPRSSRYHCRSIRRCIRWIEWEQAAGRRGLTVWLTSSYRPFGGRAASVSSCFDARPRIARLSGDGANVPYAQRPNRQRTARRLRESLSRSVRPIPVRGACDY